MSSDHPGPSHHGEDVPVGAGVDAEVGERDVLETAPRSGRRWGLVAVGAAAAVGVVGAGAWAASLLLGGGPSPATAVPGNALAYLALDLDPSATQKLAALETMRKFPALDDRLGLGASDDLRRWLFDGLVADSPCEGKVGFDEVDAWLGSRIAFGVVPGDEEPVAPFFVVQVTDQEAATAGVADLFGCGGEDEFGTAPVDDYLVVAQSTAIATRIAAAAEQANLADDPEFQRWTASAGDPGVVTGYVAAAAADELGDAITEEFGGDDAATSGLAGRAAPRLSGDLPDDLPTDFPTEFPGGPGLGGPGGMGGLLGPGMLTGQLDGITRALEGFDGAAMVVRFADGSLEVEAVAATPDGLPDVRGGDAQVAELPGTTALAVGIPVDDGFAEQFIDGMRDQAREDDVDDMLADAERELGMNLPEDLQALLGTGVSLAVDSSLDIEAAGEALFGTLFGAPVAAEGTPLPFGLRIAGDPASIMPPLQKLLDAGAGDLGLVTAEGDGAVAVGLDPDYLAELAGSGDLGDQQGFQDAVADPSAPSMLLDFNAGDWLDTLVAEADDPEMAENVAPLRAFGVSGSQGDGVWRIVTRLTTD